MFRILFSVIFVPNLVPKFREWMGNTFFYMQIESRCLNVVFYFNCFAYYIPCYIVGSIHNFMVFYGGQDNYDNWYWANFNDFIVSNVKYNAIIIYVYMWCVTYVSTIHVSNRTKLYIWQLPEMRVPGQERERSSICVLGVLILTFSMGFLSDFGNVVVFVFHFMKSVVPISQFQ